MPIYCHNTVNFYMFLHNTRCEAIKVEMQNIQDEFSFYLETDYFKQKSSLRWIINTPKKFRVNFRSSKERFIFHKLINKYIIY